MKHIGLQGFDNDRYGFGQRLRNLSNEQLVEAFNRETSNPGLVGARMDYLTRMRKEFLARNLDCSAFTGENTMSLKQRIRIEGNRLVPVLRIA